MVTKVLEPTTAAGNSSDITIAAGSTNTVAIYQGISADNLQLPNGIDNFTFPDATSYLLLVPQSDGTLNKNDWADIQLKDPDGEYFSSGLTLRHNALFKTLGPGVWRLVKASSEHEFGFQSE